MEESTTVPSMEQNLTELCFTLIKNNSFFDPVANFTSKLSDYFIITSLCLVITKSKTKEKPAASFNLENLF